MRGWQTMPTASATSPQEQQEFAIPLGAQDRRRDLPGNLVPRVVGEFPQVDEELAVLVGIALDPDILHRALSNLEHRNAQGDDVARSYSALVGRNCNELLWIE